MTSNKDDNSNIKNDKKKQPGWVDFVAFEAEPHHEPMSGPKLIKRMSEEGSSVMDRFLFHRHETLPREQCQAMVVELLRTNSSDELPKGCQKYQDVVQNWNRKRQQQQKDKESATTQK